MPESATATPEVPPFDPLNPPKPPPFNPENDPNLLLRNMIDSRKTRRTETPPATPAEPPKTDERPAKPQEKKPEESTPEDKKATGDLLFKALGFRKKATETIKDDKAVGAEGGKEAKQNHDELPEAVGNKPEEAIGPAKSIVRKPKPSIEADTARIATEAATAATREAMKSITPVSNLLKKEAPASEEGISESDRHELEVAKHLASTNPKYKGADKIILAHIKKANTYAAQWEAKNTGKTFDPDDEEHNDFFAEQEKPWEPHEFRMAEIQLANKQTEDPERDEIKRELKDLKHKQALAHLDPVIDRTHIAAAGAIARAVGEDVLNLLMKEGFDKLAESDPITAQALNTAVTEVKPLIATIIQMDDPDGRIEYDKKNPLHEQWGEYVVTKEAEYAGAENGGRTLVSRNDWSKMNPAQRAKHWFLTADHLVSILVEETSKSTVESLSTEKERQKKIALSLGYVPRETKPKTKNETPATNENKQDKGAEEAPLNGKVQSPSASAGVAIDNKEDPPKHGISGLSQALGSILFKGS